MSDTKVEMQESNAESEFILANFKFEDGKLFRRKLTGDRGYKEVICKKSHPAGYCQTAVGTRKVLFHRVIWVLAHGPIPAGLFIDHIDGDKLNNSLDNLRLVNSRENTQNFPVHRGGRLCGCNFNPPNQKWRAAIYTDNVKKHIGYYDSELEAHNAYMQAVETLNLGGTIETATEIRTKQGRLKGTHFNKPLQKWGAQIFVKNKKKHLGLFQTEAEAHAAYLKAFEEIKAKEQQNE